METDGRIRSKHIGTGEVNSRVINDLRSSNYDGSHDDPEGNPGTQGWQILKNGIVVFNDVRARGDLVSGIGADQFISITTETDNLLLLDAATDVFADSVIRLMSRNPNATDWEQFTFPGGIAAYNGDLIGGPLLHIFGPYNNPRGVSGQAAADAEVTGRMSFQLQEDSGTGVYARVGIVGNDIDIVSFHDAESENGDIDLNAAGDITITAVGTINLNAGAEEKMRIVDSGSATSFDFVARRGSVFVPMEVGAADSGGSGFRMVRVPN